MKTEQAVEHIDSVQDHEVERYTRYLQSIMPESPEDQFRRWLFTYASVHTGWQMNCKLYRCLEDLTWLGNEEALKQRIVGSRAGMHNNRTRYIYDFSEFYWAHPHWFRKSRHEDWMAYRRRLQGAALGIGQAKAAFWVELTYPIAADVICVDTHVLQLYGFTPKEINARGVPKRVMDTVEGHWVAVCRAKGVPPVIARWLYWDRKQGHSDSRYWSFVFEKENYHVKLAELARTPG